MTSLNLVLLRYRLKRCADETGDEVRDITFELNYLLLDFTNLSRGCVFFASLCLHLGEDQSAFMLHDEMLLINYCLKIWTLNETAFLPKFGRNLGR